MPDDDATRRGRPTKYKGTQMRSRTEAGYAAWLDRYGVQWRYEPGAFADEGGQYLPDFLLQNIYVLHRQAITPVYVEVKPPGWIFDPANQIKATRMARLVHASEPSAIFLVETPSALWARGDGPGPAEPWVIYGRGRENNGENYSTFTWCAGPPGAPVLASPSTGGDGPWSTEFWLRNAG